MSQNSTFRYTNAGAGPDFNLPDEILSIMPTDPYEQLDLARKITSMAIASRVSKLESETERMKHVMYEKDQAIFELEDKVSRMEQSFQESENRLKIVLDENMKLAKERDSLTITTKKLSRDLAKLTTFKRQLMQSLSDDNSSQAETVDIETCEQSMPKAYIVKDVETNGYESQQHSYSSSNESGQTTDEASKHTGKIYSITPYITPRLTPNGTPKVYSTAGSPRAYSAVGSPLKSSGRTSPIKPQYEGQPMLPSWYSSSQQSSAASSPPRGRPNPARTPRIDGKEFFRQARSLLSYEQFSAFLANIKEFNAQKQSREVTLRKAEEIFGNDNKHLYLSFQGLLNRNIH